MENITLTIDGKNLSCRAGTSILDVADANGIKIPRLCHHHSLKPFGACRICLVEDEKTGRLFASCVTPVVQGMAILSDSPKIKKHRTNIVRLMMAEHPESCVVCNKGNRCQLRKIAAELGIGETNLYPMPNYKTLEQANPFIIRDLSKCILCGKCIRADHELVATGAIDYNLRGFKSRPSTVHDQSLEHSNCTFCGTCISICPTGALSAKSDYVGTPERETVSICGFCGVGCNLRLGVCDNIVVDVNPAHIEKSVNDATLCVRGHFANDFLNSKKRLTKPLIRENGSRSNDPLIPSSWEESLNIVVNKLQTIQKDSGSNSIAFLGSSKCTNEENYIFQKIARRIVKTNNIDNGGYIYGRQLLSFIKNCDNGNVNFLAGSLSGLEKAEVIFVIGADSEATAPVVSYYMKRSAKEDIPLIVAGVRRTELIKFADDWFPVLSSGNDTEKDIGQRYLQLITGLSAVLVENEGCDLSFINECTEGFDAYKENLSKVDVGKICGNLGVEKERLNHVANLFKGKTISFVIGSETSQLNSGEKIMKAVFNLSLVTGSAGNNNAGFHIIANENNQVGAWFMGSVPDALPGQIPVKDDLRKKEWETLWETIVSPDPGLNMVQIVEAAEKGQIKALYIMGENPIRSLPQSERVRKAFEKLDFIVVQDIVENETTEIADIVLPGAAVSEKEGSFVNMEGRVQLFFQAVTPPGDAKPDLEILERLSEMMGHKEDFNSIEEVREEINKVTSLFSVNDLSEQFIFKNESRLNGDTGSNYGTGKISFFPISLPKSEPIRSDYPFVAIIGQKHYHLGSGTRTGLSERISAIHSNGEIEISVEDGLKQDIKDGDRIKVTSEYGSIEHIARIEKGIPPGLICIPSGFNQNDARNLVPLNELFVTGTKSWNSCNVFVEKIIE